SPGAIAASRAARRASTRWRAACCRCARTRRTGSRIHASRRRCPTSSNAKAPASTPTWTNCASATRSRRLEVAGQPEDELPGLQVLAQCGVGLRRRHRRDGLVDALLEAEVAVQVQVRGQRARQPLVLRAAQTPVAEQRLLGVRHLLVGEAVL